MYRSKPRDEEEQLQRQRDIVLQHKHDLEVRMASYGLFDRPSYMLIQLRGYEAELRQINRKITRAKRVKQVQSTMQQVATTGQILTDVVLPPPARGRRVNRRRSDASSFAGILIVTVVIIGIVAGIGHLRPESASESTQAAAAPLTSEMVPEPTAATIPTMPPVQETAMAVGDWPPSSAERRVIGATGGIGVRLRVDPREDAQSFTGLADGTLVYLIEKKLDDVGSVWWWVALSDGSTGYVNDKYLLTP